MPFRETRRAVPCVLHAWRQSQREHRQHAGPDAVGREGLGTLIWQTGIHQGIGHERFQVFGRLALHAGRNLFAEKFKQKIGHGYLDLWSGGITPETVCAVRYQDNGDLSPPFAEPDNGRPAHFDASPSALFHSSSRIACETARLVSSCMYWDRPCGEPGSCRQQIYDTIYSCVTCDSSCHFYWG